MTMNFFGRRAESMSLSKKFVYTSEMSAAVFEELKDLLNKATPAQLSSHSTLKAGEALLSCLKYDAYPTSFVIELMLFAQERCRFHRKCRTSSALWHELC